MASAAPPTTMAMNNRYPFEMQWEFMSDQQLISAAEANMNDLDHDDLVGLVRELAARLEDSING